MLKSEPVAVTATVAVVVQWGLSNLLPTMPQEVALALTTLIVGAVAVVARRFVFSEDTIREAGFDPASVTERAANPSIPRCDA